MLKSLKKQQCFYFVAFSLFERANDEWMNEFIRISQDTVACASKQTNIPQLQPYGRLGNHYLQKGQQLDLIILKNLRGKESEKS
jgi:hypothetical protein